MGHVRISGKRVARAQGESEKLEWWIPLIPAAAAFLAFAATIPYQFVFDDEYQILRNPWIRNWSSLGEVFTSNVWQFMNPHMVSNYYRPLQMVLYMLGYSLSGLRPYGFHIINIALHCICTALVALIGFRLIREKYLSGAAGLIFALHPIHAESVTWIAAVTDLSCAAFYFAALFFYLKDADSPDNRKSLALSLVCFFAALLSKEMALTFPLVAAFADWALHRKLRWSRYVMLTGVFAVYAAMRIHALSAFAARQLPLQLDPIPRALSTLVLFARYILKMFAPHDISAFHVFSPTTSVFSSEFALGLLGLVSFGVGGWFLRNQLAGVFLLGFCVLTLVPVLNVTRLGENVFADRYLYVPSLGACLLLPLAARKVWRMRPERLQWPALQVGAICLAMLLFPYGRLLAISAQMWRDAPTLFSETLKRSPNATIMAISLGSYYHFHGDYEKAKYWYQAALDMWDRSFIKSKANLASAYNGLGGVYLKRRMIDKALECFKKANEITPETPVVLDNLGTVYLALGDSKTALDYYQKAIAKNPRSERSYHNSAVVYLYQGKFDEAIAMEHQALGVSPQLVEAYIIMARAYAMKGMKEQARQALITAQDVDPSKSGLVESELKLLERLRF